ncbi:MAG: YggS family pyridoxal phosphate-dependent enzyme [Desulfobulbus propionicus]|nr:MAG: YggS family pyridoxal phosphate-dependent enzyme [Desulfobulbus propionicus]PIE60397.1 MAG: YggS family pyridoxal phosphate-dependent enzyme [Desulfobulbus propionicus]
MIAQNFHTIRNEMRACAKQCERQAEDVKLIAVSKRKPVELIQEAYDNGQLQFGENYLQEAAEKIPQLPADISWHFIGHLQSNKTKQAVALFDVIETVDRIKLAKLIDKHAKALQKNVSILLQINIGKEKQKGGVMPEEAELLLNQIRDETDLPVLGLMIIPPFSADAEQTRKFFIQTRKMAENFAKKHLFADNNKVELSMGMSGDFQVAIEEGATYIRIGTALFGAREK